RPSGDHSPRQDHRRRWPGRYHPGPWETCADDRRGKPGPRGLSPDEPRRVRRRGEGKVSVTLNDKGDALKILTAIEASGLPWTSFTTTHDTLEDVFVRLVGQMDEGALKTEGAP